MEFQKFQQFPLYSFLDRKKVENDRWQIPSHENLFPRRRRDQGFRI